MTAWCQERKFASLQHFVMDFEGGNYRQFFLSACPALENRRRPGASPDPPLSKNLTQCMTKTWLHDWPSTPTKILKLKGETLANFFPVHVHPFRDDVGPPPAVQAALRWALLRKGREGCHVSVSICGALVQEGGGL